jgi:hypothetical protein
VIVARKLGVPYQPELGMGAVGEDGVWVINAAIVRRAGITGSELGAVQKREQAEVEARAARYRSCRPRLPLTGRVAVVVDDGIATGSTAWAACQVARAQGAARVVLAVPVAPPGWEAAIGPDADEFVCAWTRLLISLPSVSSTLISRRQPMRRLSPASRPQRRRSTQRGYALREVRPRLIRQPRVKRSSFVRGWSASAAT